MPRELSDTRGVRPFLVNMTYVRVSAPIIFGLDGLCHFGKTDVSYADVGNFHPRDNICSIDAIDEDVPGKIEDCCKQTTIPIEVNFTEDILRLVHL